VEGFKFNHQVKFNETVKKEKKKLIWHYFLTFKLFFITMIVNVGVIWYIYIYIYIYIDTYELEQFASFRRARIAFRTALQSTLLFLINCKIHVLILVFTFVISIEASFHFISFWFVFTNASTHKAYCLSPPHKTTKSTFLRRRTYASCLCKNKTANATPFIPLFIYLFDLYLVLKLI